MKYHVKIITYSMLSISANLQIRGVTNREEHHVFNSHWQVMIGICEMAHTATSVQIIFSVKSSVSFLLLSSDWDVAVCREMLQNH